jgi:hypothetical protein
MILTASPLVTPSFAVRFRCVHVYGRHKPTMICDSKQTARTPELELAGWQKANSQRSSFDQVH